MRAATALMLAGALLLGAAACGSTETTSKSTTTTTATGAQGGQAASSSLSATTGATSSGSAVGGAGGGAGGAASLPPPYPIVLAHGFFGYDQFAGLDFAEYFHQIKAHLGNNGEAQVFTPAVDPFNSSSFRGAQLYLQIESILAHTGHEKVIIIGHSQGGLDARVVAHDHPEVVAAVVTLQTPHQGTQVADIALKVADHPQLGSVLDFLVQTVGASLYDQVGQETDLAKALYDFSTTGIAMFNAAYPDQVGIYYASVAGRSDRHRGGTPCEVASPQAFIDDVSSFRDPIDPAFALTESIIDGPWYAPKPNDGLVTVTSAKHGEFLGCVPADHLDMIGQILGDHPGFGNPWNHKAFYLDLVQFLRAKGL